MANALHVRNSIHDSIMFRMPNISLTHNHACICFNSNSTNQLPLSNSCYYSLLINDECSKVLFAFVHSDIIFPKIIWYLQNMFFIVEFQLQFAPNLCIDMLLYFWWAIIVQSKAFRYHPTGDWLVKHFNETPFLHSRKLLGNYRMVS